MQFILMLLLLQPPQIFNATGEYSVPPVVTPPAASPPVAQPTGKRYLAMFTATYCGPCQTWKLREKPKVERAGYTVIEYEMTVTKNHQRYASRIPKYPAFVVVDWDTGEWLTTPIIGGIAAETAIAQLAAQSVSAPQPSSVVAVVKSQPTAPPVVTTTLTPPVRYIDWPGHGTIDLETYSRNCNCPMCIAIRAMQVQYWKDLKAYQAAMTVTVSELPPDQQPCPLATVEAMLDAMQLGPGDRLADLGCGDGRVLIAAAKRGIPGIGIEIDPKRADAARQAVKSAGVSDMVTIETGDAREFDATRVTAIAAFLYPTLLEELAPKFRQVRIMASPYHQVPGLDMSQIGDVWVYKKPSTNEIISATP